MNKRYYMLGVFFTMLSRCNSEERAAIKESLATLSFQNLAEALCLSLASAFEVGNRKKIINRVKVALEVPALIFLNK